MGTTASATILSNLNQVSSSTETQLTLETSNFDLSTFPTTWTQPNSTYNRPVAKLGKVGTTVSATILSNLYQISSPTEFQLSLVTSNFDLSTFPTTWTQPNSTYIRPKMQNWDKWVLQLQRLSWAIYTRYQALVSSSWLSRLPTLTWVPSQPPGPNQTVFTIGQSRETGTSGYYSISDYPEQFIPCINL